MGDLLRDMMNERADTQAAPELDLDAIIRTGDRRVWRRRAVAGAGTAAAVATLALAVPAVMDGAGDDSTPPVATQPGRAGGFETRTSTYAVDTSIYYGEEAIDVSPYHVSAFVQTADGFVVATTDGTVVLADGADLEEIGTAESRRGYATLVADDDGRYVTWVETTDAGQVDFVVYDTADRQEVGRQADPQATLGGKPAEFGLTVVEAVDDGTAYWHRSDGTVAYDIETGGTTMLEKGASPQWLKDVAGGVYARSSFDDLAVVVGPDLSGESPMVPGYSPEADLSPGGNLLASYENDTLEVTDLALGADVTPVLEDGALGAVVQWIDDETFVASSGSTAAEDSAPVGLVECNVATGVCETTAAHAGVVGSVVFPDGRQVND